MDDVYAPQKIWGHTGKSESLYGVPSPRLAGSLSDEEVWDALRVHTGCPDGSAEGTPFPRDRRSPGQTVADVIAAQIKEFAAERGVDIGWASTDQVMCLHQYNIFPNLTLLASADHPTVMTSLPGPDPDRGQLVMTLTTACRRRHRAVRPTDVRMRRRRSSSRVVVSQDIAVLTGLQRGLHQPGFTHLVLSAEERRIINMHRNPRALPRPARARTHLRGGSRRMSPKARRSTPTSSSTRQPASIESDGVEAFSMRGLAERIGVAVTSIYWHVGGRDALFDSLVDRLVAEMAGLPMEGDTR